MKSLVSELEDNKDPKEIPNIVESHWSGIEPDLDEPKAQSALIRLATAIYARPPPPPNTSGRGRKRERSESPIAAEPKVYPENFLDELHDEMVAFEKLTPLEQMERWVQNPEYDTILKRAWCYQMRRQEERLSVNQIALLLGSKAAKNASSSSVITQAKSLLELVKQLHLLRRFCPKKEQIKTLLKFSSTILEEVKNDPQKRLQWSDPPSDPEGFCSLKWFLGSKPKKQKRID